MGEGGTGDTGDSTEPDNNSGWQPNDSNTLWGWLDNIVSGFVSLIESVTNIPKNIAAALESFFKDIKDAITGLPNTIKGIITEIFIPDTAYIENSMNAFLDELKMKFNFDTDFFEGLFTGEQPVKDVNIDFNLPGVGNMNLKVFDTKYLIDGIEYFRPFIRGFLVLLMALYNVKQVLSFIRQDAGIVTGKAVDMEMKERKGK